MKIEVVLGCGIMTFTHNGTAMGVDIGGSGEENEAGMARKMRDAADVLDPECSASTDNRRRALGVHRSDCAMHNEPALPNGPCDCGVITD